jgi:hypothetical protein
MIDNVVEAVRKDLLDRSQLGIKKYGVTLDRKDLSLKDWLQHAYEECLDQANYLKKCILELEMQELQREAEVRYPETLGILDQPDVIIPY